MLQLFVALALLTARNPPVSGTVRLVAVKVPNPSALPTWSFIFGLAHGASASAVSYCAQEWKNECGMVQDMLCLR